MRGEHKEELFNDLRFSKSDQWIEEVIQWRERSNDSIMCDLY